MLTRTPTPSGQGWPELAASVSDRRILARVGPVALLLPHIDAYPTGCRITSV